MKKTNKKRTGFTIVELVIVIAVIGVLAAILIPTFINLNNKARVSNTTSFLKNINTQLAAKEANPDIDDYVFEAKGNRKTIEKMSDGINYADDVMGFNIRKISPFDGNEIVWDMENHRFALIKDRDFSTPVYSEAGLKEVNAQYLHSNQEDAQADLNAGKNIYLNPDFNTNDGKLTSNGASIDATDNMNITEINIESNGDKDVYVSTNNKNCNVVINTPNADVYHDGIAGKVDLKSVPLNSYHENGSVKFVEISKGRIALEAGAEVSHIHINAKVVNNEKTDEFDKVIISYDNSVDLTEVGFSRDDVEIAAAGTLVVALQAGTETPNESTEMDYVWLTKQGIYEQIKVSDNDQSAGTVWADDSSNSAETQDAAQKIANNYVSETVRPTWESDDTNRDLADINNATEVATAVAQEEAGEAWESMTAEQKAEAVAEKEAVVLDATQAVEAQPDKADVETGVTLFAGGSGTKSDPWYIIDQETFQNVGSFYDADDTSKFYYWKVRSDITEIDMTGWTSINLQGKVEGNNVTLKNLTSPLFEKGNYCSETLTLANMKIEANIVKPGGWSGVVFRSYPGSNLLIDNVDISGYIEGNAVWSYVGQGWTTHNIEIKDSTSSITMFGAEACGGMIGYLGMYSANITLKVTNSMYNGTMIRSSNSNFSYFGFNNNSGANMTLILDAASASADFTINGNAPEAKTYTGTWAQLGNAKTVYNNENKKVVGSLTVSVENNKFVAAQGSSTRAVATLMVGPNPGNMYAGYYTEEMTLVGSNWVSSKLALINITCDNTKPIGFASDGQSFNVHGDDENIHIANILVTEYDSQGNVINVGKYTIPASYYPNGQAY